MRADSGFLRTAVLLFITSIWGFPTVARAADESAIPVDDNSTTTSAGSELDLRNRGVLAATDTTQLPHLDPQAFDLLSAQVAAEPLALSDSSAAPAAYDPEKLYFTAGLGAWALAVTGDAGVRDLKTDVDVSFDELIKHTNFAIFPSFELSKGNWVLAFNGMYAHISDSQHLTGPLGRQRGADADGNIAVIDAAIGYTIIRTQTPSGNPFLLTPAIGGRWTYVELQIDPEVLQSRSNSRNWFDPYVGLQATVGLTPTLDWRTAGTVGGFGVGSDFAWSAETMLEWHFSRHFAFDVGYRALSWDYDNDNFVWDVTFHGPWIGISINN